MRNVCLQYLYMKLIKLQLLIDKQQDDEQWKIEGESLEKVSPIIAFCATSLNKKNNENSEEIQT